MMTDKGIIYKIREGLQLDYKFKDLLIIAAAIGDQGSEAVGLMKTLQLRSQ